MTTDTAPRFPTAEEDSKPDQEENGRPRRSLRFPIPEEEGPQPGREVGDRLPSPHPKASSPSTAGPEGPGQSAEQQRSWKETPSFPVAEKLDPEKGGEGRPLRLPMPERESPQPALEIRDRLPSPHPKASSPSTAGLEDPGQSAEQQRSRKETLSFPVAEKPDPEKGGEGRPLRLPMPERESPQSALPWFTWLLGLLVITILFLCGISLWDTLNELWERSAIVGMAGLVLMGLLVFVTTAVAIQEWSAIQRINALEEIRQKAERSLAPSNDVGDLDLARKVINGLIAVYASRKDTSRGSQRLAERQKEIFAASGLIILAEIELLKTLDDRAEKVIRDTALRVATETAFMPWPLADVLLVFLSSMQMLRRIAEIYGSKPGVVASWTLSRKVLAQLVVAGALADGGRWLDAVVGNRLLHLARPIGEGVTNGALMARSGVTAMELCRPLPFHACQGRTAWIIDFTKESLLRALGKNGHAT